MTTTAAIYARLSHDKSKGAGDEGKTVEAQIEACKAFIERKGWTVGEIYSDNSISATSGAERPDFEKMLADKPPIVVAYRSSRLSRSVMDTLSLKTAGITGYLEDGGMLDFSSGDSSMLTLIRSVIDGADGEKKAEFQKLRNLRDAKEGKWHYSRPVFGNDRATGKLIPAEAKVIREAADALVAGETSFFHIAKAWNAAGFRTPKSANAGGRNWEPGTVRNFFTAPRLIGKRIYEGVTYTMDGWEPLLTEEVWLAIQAHIEAHKTGRKGVQGARHNPHLLTGIATCGHVDPVKGVCGNGLNINYRGGKGSAKAYRCTAPGHVSRVGLPLEEFIVDLFLPLLSHPGAEQIVNPAGAGTSANLRVKRLALVQSFNQWIDEAVLGDLSPKIIKKKESAHKNQLADIDAQLLRLTQDTSFADLYPVYTQTQEDTLLERWNLIPVERQRGIVRSLFKSIVVLPAPQGKRFSVKYIKVKPSSLLMDLGDLYFSILDTVAARDPKEWLSKSTHL